MEAKMNDEINGRRYIFVGGVHRSGTTSIYKLLGTDPRISIFRDTGVIEDEGQFLQNIFPVEKEYGAVGEFALDSRCHFTEHSEYVEAARRGLAQQWMRHWNPSCDFLAEKTPSNIIRSRFLKRVFKNAKFVFVLRHPVAVSLAAEKWKNLDVETMIQNWLAAYETMTSDLQYHDESDYIILQYEHIVAQKYELKKELDRLLGIETSIDVELLRQGLNQGYFEKWRKGVFHIWDSTGPLKRNVKILVNRYDFRRIERKYEKRLNRFGYSFSEIYVE